MNSMDGAHAALWSGVWQYVAICGSMKDQSDVSEDLPGVTLEVLYAISKQGRAGEGFG